MKRAKDIDRYCKNLAEFLLPHLKPNLAIAATVYPSNGPGAVVVIQIKEHSNGGRASNKIQRTRTLREFNSIGDALSNLKLRGIQGDYANIRFGGTNLFLEGNAITIVKGDDDQDTWSKRAAHEDAIRILSAENGIS